MVNYGITIGQILNFRYHKKFSSWDMSCDFEDMKHLKRVPAVFNNFKLSIHHHGVSSGDVDNNHVFCVASKCDQLDYLLKTHNITAGGILVVCDILWYVRVVCPIYYGDSRFTTDCLTSA